MYPRDMLDRADLLLLRDLQDVAADKRVDRRQRFLARVGALALAAWMRHPQNRRDRLRRRAPALAIYGRYCGKGHGAGGAPVDALDAACRRHDERYGAVDRFLARR